MTKQIVFFLNLAKKLRMKTFYNLVLACFFTLVFPFASQAQFKSIPVNIIDDLPSMPGNDLRRSFANPKKCTKDTVEYVRNKVTAYNSISVRTGSALGQFYTAPKKGIKIHGLSFYAWSIDSVTMKIACQIYKAGVDSLPSGSPLASDTLTIDSTFTGGLLSVLQKRIKFKSAVSVDFPYVVVVSAAENNKRAGVVASSWANADGDRENLLCGSVSGTWYNGLNLNVGGTTLDADMQFYPHVTYDLGSEFYLKDSCYNPRDTVHFENYTRDSTVVSNKFYNRYRYYVERYNNPIYEDFCYRWNFGEFNNTVQSKEGKNKYTKPGNYTVRLIVYNYSWRSGTCVDTNTLNIKFKPDVPTILGKDKICEGDSSDLTAYALGVTDFEWFNDVFDTIPFSNSTIINTGSKVKFDTIYARALNGTCVSGKQQKTFAVYEHPDDPIVTHDSICTQSRANLSAKSNVGVINWFASPTSNTIVHTGEVYQTGVLSSNFTYYVEALNNGCLSDHRIPVTAYVSSSFAPTAPNVSGDTAVCLRSNNTLDLTAKVSNNDTIRWYDVPSAGNPIKKGDSYTYKTSGVGVKTFYVEAWNGTCASTREAIKIETKDFPDFFKTANDTICKGDNASLIAATLSGEVHWFNSSTGGSSIHKGLTYDLVIPSSSKTFYAESSDGVCINPVREKIDLVVKNFYPFTTKNSDQICAKSHASLSAKVDQGVIKWFDEESDGNLLHTGETFRTPLLLYSQDYYVETTTEGCTSPREKISAVVITRPIAGFDYAITWPGTVTLTPITSTGVSYFWDFGDGKTTTQASPKHTYEQFGKYDVTLVVTSKTNGCKDTVTVEMDADFTAISDIEKEGNNLYPNPTSGQFTISSKLFTSEPWYFDILDISGKVIRTDYLVPINEKVVLNISNTGFYFIRATNKNRSLNFKVFVQ